MVPQYSKVGSLVKAKYPNGECRYTGGGNLIILDELGNLSVSLAGSGEVSSGALGTISIGGSSPATEADLDTALATVFLSAGGAASPTLPILVAPNDTQWVLTITNTGALVTEQLVNTVGASALTSLTLTAPDNTQWSVTVTNLGILNTTAI
jgi:hypothetical protein